MSQSAPHSLITPSAVSQGKSADWSQHACIHACITFQQWCRPEFNDWAASLPRRAHQWPLLGQISVFCGYNFSTPYTSPPPLPHHLPRHAPVTLRHSEKKIKTPGRSGSGGAKQAAINVRYLQSFHSIYTVQALQLNNNNNKTNLLILYKFSPWYHQIPPAMKNAARRGEGKFPNTFKCSQMSVDRRFVASTKTDAVCFLITSSVPIALGNIFFFLPICFLSVSPTPPPNEDSLSRVEWSYVWVLSFQE